MSSYFWLKSFQLTCNASTENLIIQDANSFDSTKAHNSKKAAKKHRALCNILRTFSLYKPGNYWEYLDQLSSI